MIIKKIGYFTLLFLGFTMTVVGQNRIPLEEVQIEGMLIDASKEKELGNFEKALELLNDARKRNDEDGAIAYEMGRIYDRIGDMENAIKYLNKALAASPNNEWFLKYQASLYQNSGQYAKAIDIYNHLVQLKPREEHNYYRKAYFYVKLNQPENALAVYDEMESKFGISEKISRRKHTLYLSLGQNDKAAHELQKLANAYPTDAGLRLNLAEFYEQNGDINKAKKVYEEVLKMDADNARARLFLSLNQKGRENQEAILALRPVFEDPKVNIDIKVTQLIPLIQNLKGNENPATKEAYKELGMLLETAHPNEAKAFAISGDIFYQFNELKEARIRYEHTLQLHTNNYYVWENLMYIQKEQADYNELIKTASKALDYFPNKVRIYRLNAIGLIEMGKYQEAIDLLSEARFMVGKDANEKYPLLVETGRALCGKGNYSAAEKAFTEAKTLFPADSYAPSFHALCLARQGKYTEAEKMDNAIQVKSANYVSINSAKRLCLANDCEKAKSILEEAIRAKPSDPLLTEAYGDVLFQLGQVTEAISYWVTAKEKGNLSPILKKKIEEKKM